MTDNLMSKIVHKFLYATSEFLGKIYGNEVLSALISYFGFCFSLANKVIFAFFTVFLAIGTVDAYTGCFSHRKVKFDRWSAGMTGLLVIALYLWWTNFFYDVGVLDELHISWHTAFLYFIYLVVVSSMIMLILYILCCIGKKLWDYLNRWQQ